MVALGITLVVNRRETDAGRAAGGCGRASRRSGRQGGFELVLKDRYLFWIAVLIVLLNVVNTTGGYVLNRLIVQRSRRRDSAPVPTISPPAGSSSPRSPARSSPPSIWSGFLLQLFVTSRVIRFMGVRGALFILPVLALVNYSIIAVAPILAVVRIGKILENSTDYSIQNTLRQALFLPTSREAKYKAKAAIDTFFTRAGDVVSAGFVALGQVIGLRRAGVRRPQRRR